LKLLREPDAIEIVTGDCVRAYQATSQQINSLSQIQDDAMVARQLLQIQEDITLYCFVPLLVNANRSQSQHQATAEATAEAPLLVIAVSTNRAKATLSRK
jgi:hypothetical protein